MNQSNNHKWALYQGNLKRFHTRQKLFYENFKITQNHEQPLVMRPNVTIRTQLKPNNFALNYKPDANRNFLSTELILSEFDDPPSNDRISTINNQHYQFHHDYDSDNGFTSETDEELAQHNALNRGPYFDISASKNVTALVGSSAYLNCRVRNLGNKTVNGRKFFDLKCNWNRSFAPSEKGDLDTPQRFAFADGRQGDLHTR